MIISPKVLMLLLLIALLGYSIVHVIANRKWGYTKRREMKLAEQPEWPVGKSQKGLSRLFQKKRDNKNN